MTKFSKRIVFFNDREIYNVRYRQDLMDKLKARGFEVISKESRIFDILKAGTNDLIVSSNLKTNLKVLLFARYKRKTVIINGLGRYRSSMLMKMLAVIISRQSNDSKIVVQNYGDYRYFRRYSTGNVVFICGSGGATRKIHKGEVFMVSRKEKFTSVQNSVKQICDDFDIRNIQVIGLGRPDNFLLRTPSFAFRGYLDQGDILQGELFLCPAGYGDGFPHAMADAIVSGCSVLMSETDFTNYGIYKFQSTFKRKGCSIRFKPCNELIESLDLKTINDKYISNIL